MLSVQMHRRSSSGYSSSSQDRDLADAFPEALGGLLGFHPSMSAASVWDLTLQSASCGNATSIGRERDRRRVGRRTRLSSGCLLLKHLGLHSQQSELLRFDGKHGLVVILDVIRLLPDDRLVYSPSDDSRKEKVQEHPPDYGQDQSSNPSDNQHVTDSSHGSPFTDVTLTIRPFVWRQCIMAKRNRGGAGNRVFHRQTATLRRRAKREDLPRLVVLVLSINGDQGDCPVCVSYLGKLIFVHLRL